MKIQITGIREWVDESNDFHRLVVRPVTEEILDISEGNLILGIAYGTGNFSKRLAEKGAWVIAFDYCNVMITHAKYRRAQFLDKISFYTCDATDEAELLSIKQERAFDKAVSNGNHGHF